MGKNNNPKPGSKCEVFNRKGVSKGIMYYGYNVNSDSYFFPNKSKAILNRTVPMDNISGGTIYKKFICLD